MMTFIGALLGTILIGLVTDEVLCWIPRLSRRLIEASCRRLKNELGDRYREEWLAHLDDIPGRLGKLFFAVDTFRASYRIGLAHGQPAPKIVRAFATFVTFALLGILRVGLWATLVWYRLRRPFVRSTPESAREEQQIRNIHTIMVYVTQMCLRDVGINVGRRKRVPRP